MSIKTFPQERLDLINNIVVTEYNKADVWRLVNAYSTGKHIAGRADLILGNIAEQFEMFLDRSLDYADSLYGTRRFIMSVIESLMNRSEIMESMPEDVSKRLPTFLFELHELFDSLSRNKAFNKLLEIESNECRDASSIDNDAVLMHLRTKFGEYYTPEQKNQYLSNSNDVIDVRPLTVEYNKKVIADMESKLGIAQQN